MRLPPSRHHRGGTRESRASEVPTEASITEPQQRRDPDISPLHADLTGLPPAFFTVGELDPLLDDSLFMAARWHAAGNHAEIVICPESVHGFTAFPNEIAARSLAQQVGFLKSRLALAPA
jgi:acetyl esterase